MKKALFILIFSFYAFSIDNFRDLAKNLDNAELQLSNLFDSLSRDDYVETFAVIIFTLDRYKNNFFKSLKALTRSLEKADKSDLKLSKDEYVHIMGLVSQFGLPSFCDKARNFRLSYVFKIKPMAVFDKQMTEKLIDSLSSGIPLAAEIFSGRWAESFCEKLSLVIQKLEILAKRLKPEELVRRELEQELLEGGSQSSDESYSSSEFDEDEGPEGDYDPEAEAEIDAIVEELMAEREKRKGPDSPGPSSSSKKTHRAV